MNWFPYAFPFFFVGMWLIVTTMLGLMSGWFNLQQWYPDDGNEEALLKIRGQSGSMGAGVALNGVLQLRAYPSGLGVRIWRVFGPFQKPLRIPWSEIEAEPSRSFFQPMAKLHLGKPENGTLKISARTWSRLLAAIRQSGVAASFARPTDVPVTSAAVGRAMFIQWLIFTGVAGSFFYFTSRSNPNGMSVVLCFVFPAIIVGIGQLIRFARES